MQNVTADATGFQEQASTTFKNPQSGTDRVSCHFPGPVELLCMDSFICSTLWQTNQEKGDHDHESELRKALVDREYLRTVTLDSTEVVVLCFFCIFSMLCIFVQYNVQLPK